MIKIKEFIRKLNGWQRLWVLVGIAYALSVFFMGFALMPGSDQQIIDLIKFLIITILWWIIPMLLVYMFGYLAGWVFRGFEGDEKGKILVGSPAFNDHHKQAKKGTPKTDFLLLRILEESIQGRPFQYNYYCI
jgi:hypothetical protein